MKDFGWLGLAILLAYGAAAAAPLLRRQARGRLGAILGWSLVPVVVLCPLLVPSARVGLRAASAFVSFDLAFKMIDAFRRWGRLPPGPTLGGYYRFLVPFPILSSVYPDHKRRLPHPERPGPQVLRLLGGTLGFVAALLAVRALGRFPPIRSSFALNHAALVPIFVLAIESLSRVLCGLERLAGFDTTPIIRNAYLARTVSEFWQRYNNRMHTWLYRNVFLPTGGRRAPGRSVLLVFLASGLFHEAALALATSRLTGYQFAFFAVQGPAALASGPLSRLARREGLAGKLVAHGTTALFLALTSTLFFDGVARIFPIYASQSPLH